MILVMRVLMTPFAMSQFSSRGSAVLSHKLTKTKKKMKKTNDVTTASVELTTEQVREMIANNQASLKESIRQHNYKLGLQLNRKDQDEILAVVNYKALLAADTYNHNILSSIFCHDFTPPPVQLHQIYRFLYRDHNHYT